MRRHETSRDVVFAIMSFKCPFRSYDLLKTRSGRAVCGGWNLCPLLLYVCYTQHKNIKWRCQRSSQGQQKNILLTKSAVCSPFLLFFSPFHIDIVESFTALSHSFSPPSNLSPLFLLQLSPSICPHRYSDRVLMGSVINVTSSVYSSFSLIFCHFPLSAWFSPSYHYLPLLPTLPPSPMSSSSFFPPPLSGYISKPSLPLNPNFSPPSLSLYLPILLLLLFHQDRRPIILFYISLFFFFLQLSEAQFGGEMSRNRSHWASAFSWKYREENKGKEREEWGEVSTSSYCLVVHFAASRVADRRNTKMGLVCPDSISWMATFGATLALVAGQGSPPWLKLWHSDCAVSLEVEPFGDGLWRES